VSADYLILITNKNLQMVGDPIACWTMIDVTLKFNEPGTGLFTCPGYDWIRDQIIPGCRIVVIRNGDVLISGPMERSLWERADDGENAGAGTLTVNFADFLSLIVSRQTYPDGTLAPAAQVIDNWTFGPDLAEHALRNLVLFNCGVSALPARQIPQLIMGTFAGLGSSVTVKAERMEPMGDVMRRIAVAGGGLGFRAAQNDQEEIEFQVYQPLDLAEEVVFGFGAGSLKYIAYEQVAPTANVAVVGGQGEGADRALIERVNDGSVDAWDRREVLVNRAGNDPVADLNAAGDEALAEGAESARVPFSVSDTPYVKFGDYSLGSKVSVETAPGSMISDVIKTIHIQVYPTAGEVISPTVGSQAQNSDPRWVQRMRAMDRRLAYLERNVVPAVV
jgi:hypothetical protein